MTEPKRIFVGEYENEADYGDDRRKVLVPVSAEIDKLITQANEEGLSLRDLELELLHLVSGKLSTAVLLRNGKIAKKKREERVAVRTAAALDDDYDITRALLRSEGFGAPYSTEPPED